MVKKINSCVTAKNKNEAAIIASAEKIYGPILKCGISQNFIKKSVNPIISEVKKQAFAPGANKDGIIKFLKDSLCDLIKIKPPFDINEKVEPRHHYERERKRRILVVAGTCGAGKTYTIAKLATKLTLNFKKITALFTINPWCVGATHKISVLSDIIGIPYEAIYKQADLPLVLDRYTNYDVIFIDTLGIALGDESDKIHLIETISLIASLKPEIYLVFSATTKLTDSWTILKNYQSAFNIQGLIFTQTDNTERFDEIFAIAAESRIPIAYLCNGQNLPDDIMIPTAEYIIDNIISC